jgi:hypothetical protein
MGNLWKTVDPQDSQSGWKSKAGEAEGSSLEERIPKELIKQNIHATKNDGVVSLLLPVWPKRNQADPLLVICATSSP